jgi:hypothetical protein
MKTEAQGLNAIRIFFIIAATAVLIAALTPGSQTEASERSASVALPAGWSSPEDASNTPHFSQTPVAALDGKGNVYICWDEWFGQLGDRRDIMFNTNKSGTWSSPRANTLQYSLIDEVGFPEVAATQRGSDAVYAWMDRDLARQQMVIDWEELVNGTWTGLKWISNQVGDSSRRVTLAASPVDDTICLVWEQNVPSGINLIYQYRDGSNGQMSAPALVFGGQAGSQFVPNISVDGRGTAHVVYYSGLAETAIWYTKNANPKNLNGWTTPIALSGGTGLTRSFPKVAAAADGDAYVVWTESHAGNEEVYLRYQVNGVWQAAIALSQTPDLSEFPSVAVNPLTKDIYVSWSESADGLTANIMVKTYETDRATGARAWSGNYQVDSNNASELSCIRATPEGDVHLVYAEGGEIWHIQRLAPRLSPVPPPVVTSQITQVVIAVKKADPRVFAKSQVDRVVLAPRKSNTIAFVKNPANDDATLLEYRLYAKKLEDPDASFAVLTTFGPADTLRYVHKKLDVNQKYAYMVGVVNKAGLELKSGVTNSD